MRNAAIQLAAAIGPAAAAGALIHYADMLSRMTPSRGPTKGVRRSSRGLDPEELLNHFDEFRGQCRSDNHAFEKVANSFFHEGKKIDDELIIQSPAAVVQAARRAVKDRAKRDYYSRKILADMKQPRTHQPEYLPKQSGLLFGISASALVGFADIGSV
jgi:hypothetical protein